MKPETVIPRTKNLSFNPYKKVFIHFGIKAISLFAKFYHPLSKFTIFTREHKRCVFSILKSIIMLHDSELD